MNALSKYKQDIEEHALLTKEQETALARQIKGKSQALREQARQKLITANLRLVVKIANSFHGINSLPLLDLISEGNKGLTRAVDYYNPKNNTRFSTYATSAIKNAIKNAIKKHNKTPMSLSLDYKYEDGTTFGDLIPDERESISENMDREEHLIESKEHLKQILKHLTDKEKLVISMRFGLNGMEQHTLEEISKVLGVTREAVRLQQKGALNKLRSMMEDRKI